MSDHWIPFKQAADYYYKTAATLKKKDINASKYHTLWIRNVQKRLFLGIATELLLKAIYLKNGFNINKPKRNVKIDFPVKIDELKEDELNPSETYTINHLIQKLGDIIGIQPDTQNLKKGLNICKVFRNKEGHVAVHWHVFKSDDYVTVENSVISLYEIGFTEHIDFKISVGKNQVGKFEILELKIKKETKESKHFN